MVLTLSEYEQFDLRTLISHNLYTQIDATLCNVYEVMTQHNIDFIAVLDGKQIAGICSREKLSLLLSHQYGRSLYLRQTLRMGHLETETRVRVASPLRKVFQAIFMREKQQLFDDVILVGVTGEYLGLIQMHRLIQLQHNFFIAQIGALTRQQEELNAKNLQMERELVMARDLQRSFLPSPTLHDADHSGLNYQFRYAPAASLSGDFIQILHTGENSMGVLLCDVMGHGVRSALITALICGLVERLAPFHARPAELLSQLNQVLIGLLQNQEIFHFVTACCLVVDPERGQVLFANAGHHPPMRLRGRDSVELLENVIAEVQPALGLMPQFEYRTTTWPLAKDDLFLLYTDGLFEAMNVEGNEFGHEKLLETVAANKNLPTKDLLDAAIDEVQRFIAPRGFDDDVCLVGVEYR